MRHRAGSAESGVSTHLLALPEAILMALGDFSGVIPPQISDQIMQDALRSSAALQLCNRVPMGTGVLQMPVPKTLPTASWVTASGTGRKPYTNIGLQPAVLTAEEVAAVIAIPDKMIEDSSINLWGFARPLLAQAIAMALDGAVIFGLNAPASFPAGGVMGAATAINAGSDAIDSINKAMAAVEAVGLDPDGSAADLTVRSRLRSIRATTGELVLGTTSIDNYQVPSLYGLPVAYTPFQNKQGANPADFVTGDWDWAILGVRQDIRYLLDPSAVIADASGVVQVSGFQDNVTPLKIWARFGFVIVNPVTVLQPAGAHPFAKVDTAAASGTAPTATKAETGTKKAA
jgi:HK97 family phage major capsid protein